MLIENFDLFTQEMRKTLVAKNKDYAGDDSYKNFELVERLGITSFEKGILVRMCDKMARLSTIIEKEAAVKDEKLVDTLMDLANYSIILASYLKDKNS